MADGQKKPRTAPVMDKDRMKNITMSIDPETDILWIGISLKEDHGPSKSGLTTTVATTGGWVNIPDTKYGIRIGVNAAKKESWKGKGNPNI